MIKPEYLKKAKETLTPEEFKVLVEAGTEAPFSGEYLDSPPEGKFNCKLCGSLLFNGASKMNDGGYVVPGWPAFSGAVEGAVEITQDNSLGMKRLEISCTNCGAHLGHVFPKPSGEQHFCVNSCALKNS